MNFKHNNYNGIIYLTQTTIWFAGHKDETPIVLSSSWTKEKLPDLVKEAKEKMNIKYANVILGEDITYTLFTDKSINTSYESIANYVAEQIPEKLTSANMIWKSIQTPKARSGTGVQICVTKEGILSALKHALKVNGVRLHVAAPVGSLIAHTQRFTTADELIILSEYETTATACSRGAAYYTSKIDPQNTTQIKDVITHIHEKYHFDIKNILLDKKYKDFAKDFPTIAIQTLPINLLTDGMQEAFWKDYKGINFGTSGIEYAKATKAVIVFLAIWTTLTLGTWGFATAWKQHKQNLDQLNKPQEQVVVVDTPKVEETTQTTATPELSDKELYEYKVVVLNGSGIQGEANRVRTKLINAGFKNIRTGNAQLGKYKGFTIYIRDNLSKDLIYTRIVQTLEPDYKPTLGDKSLVTETSDYDVLLVSGLGE